MKKTLHGPDGLRVDLDRSQVFADDPGMGSPAIVRWGEAHGTFHFALECAKLIGDTDDVDLSPAQLAWLQKIEGEVYEFLPGW